MEYELYELWEKKLFENINEKYIDYDFSNENETVKALLCDIGIENKELEEMVKLYEKGMEKGNIMAIYRLAVLYCNGTKVKKDYEKAKELYEKVVEMRNLSPSTNIVIESLISLGDLYHSFQIGAPKPDFNKVIDYYKKAIELGSIKAIIKLGRLYENSTGTYKEFNEPEQDYNKAIKLYEKAIELEDPNAMIQLGNMYLYGKGVKQDKSKAEELFDNAIELGETWCCYSAIISDGDLLREYVRLKKENKKLKEEIKNM